MKTYIILLRGINVSGKNKLPMVALRKLLDSLSFENVSTYIQSGNIVLSASMAKEEIAITIADGIRNTYAYEVPVFVYSIEEWKDLMQRSPFRDKEEKQQYFTFLSQNITMPKMEGFAKNDTFLIIEDVVYVNVVDGYGKTKLSTTFFENKLNVKATTRNFNTTIKLLELATNING